MVDKAEIEENEFNLNLPRYVDTFEPEKVVPLLDAQSRISISRETARGDALERCRPILAMRELSCNEALYDNPGLMVAELLASS